MLFHLDSCWLSSEVEAYLLLLAKFIPHGDDSLFDYLESDGKKLCIRNSSDFCRHSITDAICTHKKLIKNDASDWDASFFVPKNTVCTIKRTPSPGGKVSFARADEYLLMAMQYV